MTPRTRIMQTVAAAVVAGVFTASCSDAVNDEVGGANPDAGQAESRPDDPSLNGADTGEPATGAESADDDDPTHEMAGRPQPSTDDAVDAEPVGDSSEVTDLAMFEEPATEPDQRPDSQVDPDDGYVAPQTALDPVESVLCATIEIAHDGAVDGETKLLAEQRARLAPAVDQIADAVLAGHVSEAAEADPSSGDAFVTALGAALERCTALGYDG